MTLGDCHPKVHKDPCFEFLKKSLLFTLGDCHPKTAKTIDNLALLLVKSGDADGAEACFMRELEALQVREYTHHLAVNATPAMLRSSNELQGFNAKNAGAKPVIDHNTQAMQSCQGNINVLRHNRALRLDKEASALKVEAKYDRAQAKFEEVRAVVYTAAAVSDAVASACNCSCCPFCPCFVRLS